MKKQLTLEILSGPLDGAVITLREDTLWRKSGNTQLSFPWDAELGDPQACFISETDGWYIEGNLNTPHGTYHFGQGEKIKQKIKLSRGDLLKAGYTWLRVESL